VDLKKIFRSEIGLGTQATRAQIIETLLKRNYIERSAKNLRACDKGVHLVDRLSSMPSTSALTSVSQTAKLELRLQSMADGEEDDLAFLDQIEKYIQSATNEWKSIVAAESEKKNKVYSGKYAKYNKNIDGASAAAISSAPKLSIGACPLCQATILDFPKSFSCSRWKEGCGFTIWKVMAKKKLSITHIKILMTKRKTDLIKGFKSKTGKSFEAYLLLNQEGKVEFEFKSRL